MSQRDQTDPQQSRRTASERDQPRVTEPVDAIVRSAPSSRSGHLRRPASRADDEEKTQPTQRPDTSGSLRTRPDPLGSGARPLRPPSSRPAWEDEEARQQRGSARYRINPEDLPPAYLPDDAPSWMGEPAAPHSKHAPEEPVIPHPASPHRHPRFAENWPEQRPPVSFGTSGTGRERSVGEPSSARPPARSGPAEGPYRSTEAESQVRWRSSGQVREGRSASTRESFTATRPPSAKGGTTARERSQMRSHQTPRQAPRSRVTILHDPTTRAFFGAITLSVSGLWIFVTTKDDALSGAVPLRVGTDGETAVWGTPLTMLRLPFLSSVLAVLSVGTALLVAPYDAFASRFTLGMGFVAQVLAWVAAFALLW